MTIDFLYFKKKLEEEKNKIERELSGMSMKNPENKNDWEAVYPEDTEEREADPNDQADNIEDYEERYSLNDVLEKRLNEVKTALSKIEDNSYGKCKTGGDAHPIEETRLEANPAATTCIEHLDE